MMWTRLRTLAARLSACREIPVDAASLIMAINFLHMRNYVDRLSAREEVRGWAEIDNLCLLCGRTEAATDEQDRRRCKSARKGECEGMW